MKRLISLILALALLLSLAPAVFAEETQTAAKVELVFGTPTRTSATDVTTNEQVSYYEIPVSVKNNTNNSITLSSLDCHINYDALGLEPVNIKTGSGLLDRTQAVSYGEYLSVWNPNQTASAGLIKVIGSTADENYYKAVASGGEYILFTLNLKPISDVENGDYHLNFAEPYYSANDGRKCNLLVYETKDEVITYSQDDGTLDCSATATITVTDGANPTLKSVSVDTTAGNPVYGTAQSFDLKAISTSEKDITSLVSWSVTPADCITIENGKAKTSATTPAGDYEIKGTYGDNSFETTLTVDKAKLDSVSLTLTGYEKGKLVSDARVTGNHCTVSEGGYLWNGDRPASNDRFQAATSYKLSVAFTIDSNYLLEAGSKVTLTVGEQTVTSTCSFDGMNYLAEFQLPETGNKDSVEITTPPTAGSATFGDTLSDVTLTGGTASVDGSFAWTNGNQSVGNAGEKEFEVTFTPTQDDMFQTATAKVTVKVNPKSIEANDVTIEEIPSQSYTGLELQPTPTIKFRGEDLELGTDFTLVYNNNTDCGTATVTITGQNNYTGTCEKTFQITKSISACTIAPITGTFVYSGTAFTPEVTVKDGETTLTLDKDYTVTYGENINAGEDAGLVTVTGKGNYTGEKLVNFTIDPQHLSLTEDMVTISGTYIYDGQPKTPAVDTLTVGNATLTKDKDYTVEYDNNTNAGNNAEIIIKPIEGSNYTFDTCTKNFSIEKAFLSGVAKEHNVSVRYGDSSAHTFSADDVTGLAGKGTFTMSHIQVPDENTIFTYGEFKGLMTYHLKTTKDNVDQTISVKVTFSSTNYEPVTVTLKVTIVGKLDANLMVNGITDKMSMTYGDTKTLTWSVAEAAKGGKIEVTSSANDVIAVENNTLRAAKVGTAKITVKYETADYYDEAEFNITVNKKPITVTAENMTVVYGDGWDGLAYDIPDDALVGKDSPLSLNIKPETKATSESPVGKYPITLTQAEGANPNYAVTMNPGTLTITKAPLTIESATVKSKEYDGNKTATVIAVEFSGLKNNETLTSSDYTATGEFKDANAGENKDVTVTVTLNTTSTAANYELKSNTLDAKGTIEKRTTQVKFTEIKDATYTGKPYARENYAVNSENAVFKFFKANGEKLGDEISAPTDVGKYYITAIVEETANEKLSAMTVGFEITAKSLADADITVEAIPDQTYTGEQLKPAVTIKYNGMTLTAGTDYTVAYENCTNVGVATAKITGKGNYEGTTTKTFNITAKPVTNAQVTFSTETLTYNGAAQHPAAITVKIGDTVIPSADYTVSYSNNVNAGTATATVSFIGNYSGTATGTFTIAPKPVGIDWTGDTFFYDKTEKTVTATATGVETDDTVNVTVKGGMQTAIGTYIATATALDNTNYTLPTDGLTHPFEIKNAIASISVTSPATVSTTVDGLTIKLVGTKKDDENTLQMKINGDEVYVSFTNDTVLVGVGENEYITYKLDKSDLKETPTDVDLTEIKPAVETTSKDTNTVNAANEISQNGGAQSKGLAAAAAEAVTNEAASKASGSGTIKAETKLEIQVESYVPASSATDNKATLTLEITPKVTYKDAENKVIETKEIPNSAIKAPVTISVKLPATMPTDNLFVKHKLANGGVEYLKVTVTGGVATWQQSSFSPVVLMSDARTASITLVKENGEKITMTLDLSSIGTALPKDNNKTNWQFNGIDGSYSTITKELFDMLAEKGTVTATSVSGSSSDSDSKPSKPGNSSSGPLLPSLGDDELIFRDVSKYDYYYNAVKWALKKGVTSGTGRYTFSPDDACTRAQTVTFLWRAAGCPKATAKTNPFTDVHTSDYFYEAVLWAVENGITNGTSSTTFSPNASVTRAQVATFLWRANGEPAAKDSGFTDVAANAYYARAVAWAYAEGITTGTGFGVFSPEAICTRAQIVTFLFRNAK